MLNVYVEHFLLSLLFAGTGGAVMTCNCFKHRTLRVLLTVLLLAIETIVVVTLVG